MGTVISTISEILREKGKLVAAGNALDRSYHEGAGDPGGHTPFGIDQPETVAVNAAGLYALVETVGLVALLNGRANDQGYAEVITFFARLESVPEDKQERILVAMAMRFAHATWMAGQPFRGISTDPLGRVSRSVVMVFDELPPEEQLKDFRQIVAAARWLADELGINYTS